MAEFPVIESMTKIVRHPYTIRIWRTETELKPEYDNRDLQNLAWIAGHDIARIATQFAKIERVAAVEVTDTEGNGIVLYTEWP